MLCCIVWYNLTDTSEMLTASTDPLYDRGSKHLLNVSQFLPDYKGQYLHTCYHEKQKSHQNILTPINMCIHFLTYIIYLSIMHLLFPSDTTFLNGIIYIMFLKSNMKQLMYALTIYNSIQDHICTLINYFSIKW